MLNRADITDYSISAHFKSENYMCIKKNPSMLNVKSDEYITKIYAAILVKRLFHCQSMSFPSHFVSISLKLI